MSIGIDVIGRSPNENGRSVSYSPERGLTESVPVVGTEQECKALGRQILATRPDLTFQIDPLDLPQWIIRIQSPEPFSGGASDFAPVWELDPIDEYPDILSSSEGVYLKNTNAADWDRLLNAIKADTNYATAYATFTTPEAKDLWAYIHAHGETYLDIKYALRKNIVVQRAPDIKASLQVSFAGVHEVWTTTRLRQVETTIDLATLFSITQIPVPTVQTGYNWGWLKKGPQVSSEGGGRSRIRQEYWLAQWRSYPYPAYTG